MLAMDDKKYTFEVDTRANKTLVKQAVEAAFDVKVKNVNIVNVRAKFKRMGKYAGYTKTSQSDRYINRRFKRNPIIRSC